MNRTVFIRAPFKVVSELKAGEYDRGFFGKQVVEEDIQELSKSEIDGEKLALLVGEAIAELNRNGYRIVSLTPVTSGAFDSHGNVVRSSDVWQEVSGAHSISYGYGYSYTEGIIILAERTERIT